MNSLDYGYQISVLTGFRAAAEAAGVNTLCFAGAELNSPDPDRKGRNTVFDLISARNVDGVVILASSMCGFLNPRELEDFTSRFKGLPAVSLGMALKGIPSIVLDNKRGMRDAADHLIEAHGYRKLLFLGGPSANREAVDRLEGFRESLGAHGIPIDPRCEKVVDFFMQPAQRAVLEFLEAGGEAEAIVAANDNMAIGALRALREKGVSVPRGMAVSGFDDVEVAGLSSPPMTTVRQPIREMAEKALRSILKVVAGDEVPELEYMAAALVVRRSCGCVPYGREGDRVPVASGFDAGKPDYGRIEAGIAEAAAAGGAMARGDPIRYAEALGLARSRMEHALDEARYALAFDGLLRGSGNGAFDEAAWEEFLSYLHRSLRPHAAQDAERVADLEGLIRLSGMLVKDMARHAESEARLKAVEDVRALQRSMRELIYSSSLGGLFEKMARVLPRVRIRSCYLSLHAAAESAFKEARLAFAYDEAGRIDPGADGEVFPAEQLFPRDLVRLRGRFDLVVESIVHGSDQLGFMVLEMDPRDGPLVASMSDQVRSSIRASMLTEELSAKSASLERALADLKSNQERLLISEKMASLGRLTSGIAHEMNSPLAAARASLSMAQGFIAEYRMSLDNPAIEADDHRKISDDMARAVSMADKAIEQATNFIRSIKAQTRDAGGKEAAAFDLVDLCKKALLLLSFALKRVSLSVDFRYPREPVSLRGRPDTMMQAVTSLVLNAIEAMEGKPGEAIVLALGEDDKAVTVKVADGGRGIPAENMTKIFDPLFTTKPFGDSAGLGLTIVHDIVYGEYNGTIEVESVVGKGSAFKLVFPK